MYKHFIKTIFDFLCSFCVLIIFSPFLLLLVWLIKIKLGSPVLFTQKRPGYKGRLFTLYKFRTMNNKTDARGNLLPDEQRLTKFGKFLRSTSLDELPELFNILKGDMSFVGPRPLLTEYLPLYSEQQKRRHDVKPGLTGWAQINGRNAITWQDKFKMDVWYVDNISFLLDIKIIWHTFWRVLKKEGISQKGHATMEKFTGNAG